MLDSMFKRSHRQDFTVRSDLMLSSVRRQSRSLFPELGRATSYLTIKPQAVLCKVLSYTLVGMGLQLYPAISGARDCFTVGQDCHIGSFIGWGLS